MTSENTTTAVPSVLVAAASKHGSTAEIAARIALALRTHGLGVTVIEAGRELRLEDFDGVILGSAVYAGHWRDEAMKLAESIANSDHSFRVWLFSSGPLGEPPHPDEDPLEVESLLEKTKAVEHRLFAGKMDKQDLSLGEKAIVRAVRAPYGDFRDWDEIEAWAGSIAVQLLARAQAVEA